MNKPLAIFLAASAIGLAVTASVVANAQGKVSDPALVRVDVHRGAQCTGVAHYSVAPVDAQLQADLGARTYALPVIIPCAKLNAVDALLPLPDTRAGKLGVQTQDISLYVRDDGTCYADLTRTLAPVDVDVAAAMGTRTVLQHIDIIACSRLSQAVTGALVRKGGDANWPSAVVSLPLPLEP